jgi:hypothetical protein
MAGRPADLSNPFPIPTVNTDRHKEKGRRSAGSVTDPAYRPFTPTTRSGGMNLAFENHLFFEACDGPIWSRRVSNVQTAAAGGFSNDASACGPAMQPSISGWPVIRPKQGAGCSDRRSHCQEARNRALPCATRLYEMIRCSHPRLYRADVGSSATLTLSGLWKGCP